MNTNTRFMVTGGAGFLGRHVVAELQRHGMRNIFVPRKTQYDLTDEDDVWRAFCDGEPEIVIHLAASVGGIGANQENPGRFLYENSLMGLHVMEAARLASVKKFVGVGTVCEYPKHAKIPFRENELWDGYPEETNAPYGIAKRLLLAQGQAYRKQYGFNAIHLLPVNLYGPYDNFTHGTSHVIPAMIRRCTDAIAARAPQITCWGTGRATREFLYVADCAEAIVAATSRYDGPEPINLGGCGEISMAHLLAKVAALTGYNGDLAFDNEHPDGQPRRCIDSTLAAFHFQFKPTTTFDIGLAKTIAWWKEQCVATSSTAHI